ncbi:TonB-dependent receptor [Mucilaginibacter daejeonensis]|uniref:SusC/RagA family TonB-linked outer membrane protein n=1 Tax=Mucilaginibacter daejeonensis TaxID=398049 RepID=UPI001D170A0F|nr:TonB-dependent receptor [Mucilaginibacter daejeonensis]UEG51343.1 TonB-dependent receptor [Mucilaginibacter daejeonensis]
MKLRNFLLIFLLPFFWLTTNAQNVARVTGKVTDTKSEALVGVNIAVKGTTGGTSTDVNGMYKLTTSSNNVVLVFSYIGYNIQEINLGGRSQMDVVLEANARSLNEVVVTGYQTERKKDLTGSVAIANVSEMKKQVVANPIKALQGQVPGMYITGNGAPSSPVTVRIRGIGTLNDNNPLYVIDGVPTKASLSELNSADIESIQVLKSAAAASIYGSRAANGVIIVTTKHGKNGVMQANVNAYTALSTYARRIKMLDAEGFGRALWQANVNSGADPNTNGLRYQFDWNVDPTTNQPVLNRVTVAEYLDDAHTLKSANTNWFDEVSRLGVTQNYDVQVSNGTANGNYLWSLGYFDNQGIIKTTDFNRISARLNSDYKLFNGVITLGQNLSLNKTREVSADIINATIQALPIIPVHTVDGKGWGGPVSGMNDRQNPVRVLEDNRQNSYDFFRVFGNFFAEAKLWKGLQFRSNIGFDYGDYTSRNWQKKYQSGYLINDVNQVVNVQTHNVKLTWTNTLNYDLVKGDHRVNAVAGTEFYSEKVNSFSASRLGYILEDPDYMYLDAGTGAKDNSGYGAKNTLFSYFGKANYSFKDRYLLSGVLRYDGSSRFGQNNRFGIFPAFSAGWRISEEPFFKQLATHVDELKLRYDWGKTGNQEIPNNAIFNIYSPNYNITAYDIEGKKTGVLPSGFYLSQNANPNLKWEATVMSNFGLDFSILNQKLYGSVEYYIKKTSDILLLPPYIGVLGEGGNTWVNGASMQNNGFELTLGHRSKIGKDLSIDLTGNMDIVRSKITALPTEVVNAYGGDGRGQNILGRTVGSFFGYVADGLFRTTDEVNNAPAQNGKGLGRIRYRDLNNDGVINEFDRTWIGNPLPKFTYGFNAVINYKGFDLSFLLQGVGKVDVRNETKLFTDFWSATETNSNKGSRLLDAWSPTNPNSTIPALSLTDVNFESRPSTYFIENGAYLKLRNAQLGYTFGNTLLSKIKVKTLRAYIGGDNLAILYRSRSFTGLDPETPAYGYPNPLVVTAGINLKF